MPYQLPIHRPKCQFCCGIDPDIDKSGLVIYDRLEQGWFCKTLTQYELQEVIIANYKPDEIEIFVESGWENESFFHQKGFPNGWNSWPEKSKLAYIAKAASRVGENFGVGKSIAHLLSANGYSVTLSPPKTAKWNADEFRRRTGLKNGHNEEIRDAARTMWNFR